ncbi:LAQU0S19e00254g1_1 [Lachancea quebecensis]|uniref:LAQU0S19e00254g1_1 n=1 Tax=Lachancea quebecensis TaxID=1654605 RepID=A0A0N7MMC6_9SACH|nr:LAQU0S19e00254g1_1 [Lachancea quebecensis]
MENTNTTPSFQPKSDKRRREGGRRKPKHSSRNNQVNEKSCQKDSRKDSQNGDNNKKKAPQRRLKSRRRKLEDLKHSDTNLLDVPKTTRLSKQCKEQIQQFQHIIGKENFKVFKKSKNSTSYGLAVPSVMDQENFVFLVTIPFSYPSQPLKLDSPSVSRTVDMRTEDGRTLANILNNFNSKSREMTSLGESLAAQMNYLITQWSKLSDSNYKRTDKLYKEFLAEVVP